MEAFLNASHKTFTPILQKRNTKWIEELKLLKKFQAGLRAGYLTIDHIGVLKSIAESYMHKGKKLYKIFFIDYKSALDMVQTSAYLQALRYRYVTDVWIGEEL